MALSLKNGKTRRIIKAEGILHDKRVKIEYKNMPKDAMLVHYMIMEKLKDINRSNKLDYPQNICIGKPWFDHFCIENLLKSHIMLKVSIKQCFAWL